MTSSQRRRLLQSAAAAGGLAAFGAHRLAAAQALDTVRLITGFPAGGTSDTTCRRVAERLRTNNYARNVLVENRTGAGGQIAVQSMGWR